MKQVVEVKDYSPEQGVDAGWHNDDAHVAVSICSNSVVVQANRAGLINLARSLLTLAQEEVPAGSHTHLDEFGALAPGSAELILERTNA